MKHSQSISAYLLKFLKRACAVSAFVFPLSASALGIQIMIDGNAVTFIDVQQTAWYAGYVRESAEAGIVNGYEDDSGTPTGIFGPSNSITLAEALKIAVEGAGYDENAYGSTIGSGVNHWASPYISVAMGESFDLMAQHPRVRWNDAATRAEVASFFASAFLLDLENMTDIGSTYQDVSAQTQFGASIEALTRGGVVSGDTDVQGNVTGTFRPTSVINRAEVVKMVIEARSAYGTPGTDRKPVELAETENVVSYSGTRGFLPMVMRIKLGESVTFRNSSTSGMWVASDRSEYPELNSLRSLGQGQQFIFTFNRVGTWGYNNRSQPGQTGTIIVEEN